MGIWTVMISCHFLVKVQVKFASAYSSPRCLFLGTMRHIGNTEALSFPYLLLATSEITEIKEKTLLLMAEILHQLRLLVYPIIYRALYISGGSLGFQPSTVVHRVLPVQVLNMCVCSWIFHSSWNLTIVDSRGTRDIWQNLLGGALRTLLTESWVQVFGGNRLV